MTPVIPELVERELVEARNVLCTELVNLRIPVSDQIQHDLVQAYSQTLARLTNLVLLQRYSAYHLVRHPLWRPVEVAPGDAMAGSPREVLDGYISWEQTEHLFAVDGPYPELARLIRLSRRNWLAGCLELLDRIDKCRSELGERLGIPELGTGSLERATFGISDPHGGGRTAALLSFGAGQVVYKPRSMDGELGWSHLHRRVLEDGLGSSCYTPWIISRPHYGFTEFVSHDACADRSGVHRAYRRYGALMATAHALGTCDLHHENIIVRGEHPVVIDAEPLFRARLAVSSEGAKRLDFERSLSIEGLDVRESVLELGVLPLTLRSPLAIEDGGTAVEYEIGALCGYGHFPITDLVVCGRGSDQVQMRLVETSASVFSNLPCIGDEPVLPDDFVDDIVDGFRLAHGYLRGHRAELSTALSPMADYRVRLLARPTMDYVTVVSRSLSPDPLRGTRRRSDRLDHDLALLTDGRFDVVDRLGAEELQSMFIADVPRHECAAGETDISGVPLLQAPIEAAAARWAALDDVDLDLQVACIRQRLHESRRRQRLGGSPGDLMDFGLALVAAMAESADVRSDTSPWVYALFAPGLGTTMVYRDRESLYEGAAGTAIVLAEAGRLTGDMKWKSLARSTFAPLMEGRSQPASIRRGGGLARGFGGLLYAMGRTGAQLDDDDMLSTATSLARAHAARLAHTDALDEILYGRAGLLLALLSLALRTQQEEILALADDVAGILVRRALTDERGACWPGTGSTPNVSHGTAGIAMALSRWSALRGDEATQDLALEALRYDDSFWVSHERGWLDARSPHQAADRSSTNWGWCNGRSGGLLARISVATDLGLTTLDGHTTLDAMTADPADVIAEAHSGLCCGTPGVVDALLAVTERVPSVDLNNILSQAITVMHTATPPSQLSTLTGTLFTGMAGTAFACIRAAQPEGVRPLLLFP